MSVIDQLEWVEPITDSKMRVGDINPTLGTPALVWAAVAGVTIVGGAFAAGVVAGANAG